MLAIPVITAVVVVLVAFFAVFRNHRSFSHIMFSAGLLSTMAVMAGDSIALLRPDLMMQWKRVVFIGEVIMAAAWLLFAESFARRASWKHTGIIVKFLIILVPVLLFCAVYIPMDDFFYSPEFESEQVLFLGNAGYVFNLLLLVYAIFAIINLEATLKSSTGIMRWNIKYTLIGVGGVLAMNIFYYSHALLYRSLNMNFVTVRTAIFLLSTLVIGFSLIRHRVLDIEVAVSRKIVYRSLALFVIGFYLLGLGLVGKGLRYFGPDVGMNITFFLGFAGAILVLVVILSDKIRRKVMVVINKNFYKQKYDYREQWLQFTQLISLKNSLDELLDSIAEGFVRAIGSRGAAVWLRGKNRDEYECMKTKDFYRDGALPDEGVLSFLREKMWVIDISDPECRKVMDIGPEFLNESKDTSLIVPLFHSDELIGFIVLREGLVDEEFNFEDYDFLKVLASQAAGAILNARLSDELVEAKEMEAMGRVSSFIVHDLKNAASMLSLTAQNAEQYMNNPDFQKDAIRTVINTTEKINSIIDKLRTLPRKTELTLASHDLGTCVDLALRELGLNGVDRLSYRKKEPVEAAFDREEIIKVISNLVINALEATGDGGRIEIVSGRKEGMGYVKVVDSGCGMSGEFIENQLFKPFHTTKKKGLGIGLYQCKTIVEAHSGKLSVISAEGRGSEFTVYLPLFPR